MKKLLTFALLGVLAVGSTGCMGPVKQEVWEEVAPNETAFLVALEGDTVTNQAKFNSIEYLREVKVAQKRIIIPQRQCQIGHRYWQYEWVPTAVVIKVDRSPVTRVWTAAPQPGTSKHDDALGAESVDSIGFRLGATITCSIAFEDAEAFLYYHAGRSLSDVVDTNVRGFILNEFTQEFGKYPTDEISSVQSKVFDETLAKAREFFKKQGITIEVFGSEGGIVFENPEIQAVMDRKFTSMNEEEIARQEQAVAKETFKIKKEKATAEMRTAQELFKAQEATLMRTKLAILKLDAETAKLAADNWNGVMPSGIVPQGSGLLFGLDRPLGNSLPDSTKPVEQSPVPQTNGSK